MIDISIPTNQLIACAMFSAEEKEEQVISGIHVHLNEDKSFIEATNRHILCRIPLNVEYYGETVDFVIPKCAFKFLKGKKFKNKDFINFTNIRVDETVLTVMEHGGESHSCDVISGNEYPVSNRIMAMYKNGEVSSVRFDFAYMATMEKARALLTEHKAITMEMGEDNKAAFKFLLHNGAAEILLMPMRD